ncbi:MAG: amidohydrolase family protein [Candidatus Poseidoniia archaeon]|nr:amidohydrolase family protein [Candidatus Poseidoniia archaeon]MDP6534176.1 amidohydrolase family protein [Candidatus Poseidoniia archaeon]MDP6835386.1 amidohydrolase family protein [Candidatus Poseidoniia archaeon]HIH79482.1 amidohydrolase family protein [Candidatus Poseidoniia archaeon]|tara:strand:- start:6209 stop:7225 length:1017 start_codon:yes stop_codon:yes gene_type:complete
MLWAGPVLTANGFIDGWFDPGNGENGDGEPPGPATEGVILPPFRNCHTHLGDTLARGEVPDKLLAELVGPDGFKQRWLADADVAASITAGLREAADSGTALILDFREGGELGLEQLSRGAADAGWCVEQGAPQVIPFGRANGGWPLPSRNAGLSGLKDLASGAGHRMAIEARVFGGLVALHFSEVERESLELMLEHEPDVLVHLCNCSDEDLHAIAEKGLGVVVCPRSNARFGLRPPLEELLALGVDVGVGTDNGMLCTLDMLAELRFCREVFPDVAPDVLLQLACWGLDETLKKAKECKRLVDLPGGRILLSQPRVDPLEAVFDPRAKVLATRFTCE